MAAVPEPQRHWSALFAPGQGAPQAARTWLQNILENLQGGLDGEAALLLLTELVTNAVCYSASQALRVDVELLGDKLVVGVSDDEPRPPTTRAPGPDDIGGRGLVLVDRLSADWGVSRQAGGKRVWFNLNRTKP